MRQGRGSNNTPLLRGKLAAFEPMSKHTSWRVGGAADNIYFPADLRDLTIFLQSCKNNNPVYFTGLGSNLLIRDGGIRGTVVITSPALRGLHLDSQMSTIEIYAEAGITSPKLAKFSAQHGLEGLEFLAGVPGTVGGALAMNAGCYGHDTWGRVARVKTVNKKGDLFIREPNDFVVGYRSVITKSNVDEFFVAGWFLAEKGDQKIAKNKIKNLLRERARTQPTQQPNAGSVFRNPPGDYAARLIEKSGLKGFNVGGALVSQKHANFFVNTGDATAHDFESLIKYVRDTVLKNSGIKLEPEIIILGED